MHICCIGAGYVGGPTMAVVAKHCPSTQISVVDVNAEQIQRWNSDVLPIFEPGLDEIVRATRGRNLRFTTDVKAEIAKADIVFIAVNTPTKESGVGAGCAADIKNCERCARTIAEAATSHTIVVEKSTVPVRTADAVERIITANATPGATFTVLSNPEFLAEGTAIRDLEAPARVLIGGPPTSRGRAAMDSLAAVYAHWVPRERILTTNVWSAELSKLVANAFLAQRISSINAISALCERTRADVTEVARAIGTDPRIGPGFLQASIGFGGSCFQKDVRNLVYLCHHFGLPDVAAYWEQVISINTWQRDRFARTMVETMMHTVTDKRIAIFGFAFKKNTGDVRETSAAYVIRRLHADGARCAVYDPAVTADAMHNELARLDDTQSGARLATMEASALAAATGAHAIAVVTEWDEFATYDYQALYDVMAKPAFVFDGRNVLDHRALRAIGFEVYVIGRPTVCQGGR